MSQSQVGDKLSAGSAAASEGQKEALILRAQGLTYDKIGERQGISGVAAWKRCQAAMRAHVESYRETAHECIKLEELRLDELYEKARDGLNNGEPYKAIDACLRISDSRRKLLGLDAPQRVKVEQDADELLAELYEASTKGDLTALEALRQANQGLSVVKSWGGWMRAKADGRNEVVIMATATGVGDKSLDSGEDS